MLFRSGGIITSGDTYVTNGISQLSSLNAPLPVQLVSFHARMNSGGEVLIEWETLSEVNNFGFWVERAQDAQGPFATIPDAFLEGHGTSTVPHSYAYVDRVSEGGWYYRLRQLDLDGSAHYSEVIAVDVTADVPEGTTPREARLLQNYPNPFNPSSTILFELPAASHVRLELFDGLGRAVRVLVDEIRGGGVHAVSVDGHTLASGVYHCVMTTKGYRAVRTLILLK